MVGQLIYGLALSLITPLGSKYDAGRHRSLGQYELSMNALVGSNPHISEIWRWEAIMKGRQVGRTAWLRGIPKQRLVYSKSGYVCVALQLTGDASREHAVSADTRV